MNTDLKLNSGNYIPVLGLGTWKSEPNIVGEAVRFAIKNAGYKHIDCASIYGNETEIGAVFKEVIDQDIKREELFVTSKLWNNSHKAEDVEKACVKTLQDLKLNYLDLYLVHWGIAFKPGPDNYPHDLQENIIMAKISIQETWHAMENLVKKGLVKSIGVANFTTIMLIDLLSYSEITPAMNQVEIHPYNIQSELIDFCNSKTIAVTAYSPLARQGASGLVGPSLFEEPVIKRIAKKYQKSCSQIVLNWGISRNTIVIPKSVHAERIKENTSIFNFQLNQEEVNEIATLNKNLRFVNPIDWWKIPYFS